MSLLSNDEKMAIVRSFYELQCAVRAGDDPLRSFQRFRLVYRGSLEAVVDRFPTSRRNREAWLDDLRPRLAREVGLPAWTSFFSGSHGNV
jgi:hypothetical protein